MRIARVVSIVVLFCLFGSSANAGLIDFSSDKAVLQQMESVAPGSAQDFYLRGVRALSLKQLESAKQYFNKSIQKDNSLVKPLLGLAEVAFLENNLTQAKQYLLKALKTDDKDPYALTSIGRYYYVTNLFPDAEASFKKAVKVKPNFVSAHIALGDLYNNANSDYSKAEKAYREALIYDPENSGAHYALGVALLKQERFAEAENSLIQSGKLAQENPLPIGMLGYVKYRQKEYKAALNYYDEAIQRNPQYIQGFFGKYDIYIAQEEQDLAISELENVLAVVPKHPEASYKLGMIYQSKGRQYWGAANKYYQDALISNPKLSAAYNNLAWMALEEGSDIKQAFEWAQKANAIDDKVPSFMDTLAWVYREKGDLKSALKLLKAATEIAPSDPSLRYHLGVIYYELGNVKNAKQELELALNSAAKFDGYDNAKEIFQKIK